jgi:hypothetical protein
VQIVAEKSYHGMLSILRVVCTAIHSLSYHEVLKNGEFVVPFSSVNSLSEVTSPCRESAFCIPEPLVVTNESAGGTIVPGNVEPSNAKAVKVTFSRLDCGSRRR